MPNITYEDFKQLASRPGLALHERIDDPLHLRAGKCETIVADICRKLTVLHGSPGKIVDIGPGCTELPQALIAEFGRQGHQLWLIDSAEMLGHLPDAPSISKIPGQFPAVFPELRDLVGQVQAVLVYSVLHYVFEHDNIWAFLDRCLALLAPGGQLLLGDVPSWSKRKRMLAAEGQSFPAVEIRDGETWPGGLTDGVIFGLMARATEAGFDAYLLPQPRALPFARRRVDLLFGRPGP